jgi:CheY-like chemotaxis protein
LVLSLPGALALAGDDDQDLSTWEAQKQQDTPVRIARRVVQPQADSDRHFRVLAETLPHAVWLCRNDGSLDYMNAQGLDYFGLPFGTLARQLEGGALVHRADRERVLGAWRDAIHGGKPFDVEGRLRRFDSAMRWHVIRAQPVLDAGGAILMWLGTATDVHEVKEANDRAAFLVALTTELARVANPQELVCTAMARLRARLDASRVTLAEIDEEHAEAVVLRQAEGNDLQIEMARLPHIHLESLAADSRLGLTTVVRDARRDVRTSAVYASTYELQSVNAFISAPLLHGGSLVALLSAVQERPRDWTESEVELVNRVADIVWPALEKARADRRIAMSDERLRLAQAVAQIGAWEWDPDSHAMSFSPECHELFGLATDEPSLHQEWLANIDAKDVDTVRSMLEDCARSGTAEIEYRYRHPVHGPRWIYSKAGLVKHDSAGYVVGISLDVTERRQAEETLKEVNQRKDEFLAMLAHELRNPLAPIRNAAQILNVHASGKPQLEWVRAVIERQTRHLVRLVDDLLDVSRMVRGQIVLQKSPVELGEIVRHAVETSRPLIRMRKHRLDVRLPDEALRLNADLTRMAQVLANLLNNAAKYTDEGGQIVLEAGCDGDEVTICVRDNGPGISPALLPQVFDMFTQADRTLDRAQGGLGIGLTLVKRLVEMHGGSVEARSEGLGQGAEFVVRLPLLAAEEEELQEATVRTVDGHAHTRGLRILVVDDNVDAADSIAILLSMEGHQTQTVNNAHDALIAATEFRPDVVLLDIGLPEMDGYEVARRLRSENAIENLRLVAVTGYGQPADRARAQAAGFDKHLVKPVEPAALNEFLRTVQSPP